MGEEIKAPQIDVKKVCDVCNFLLFFNDKKMELLYEEFRQSGEPCWSAMIAINVACVVQTVLACLSIDYNRTYYCTFCVLFVVIVTTTTIGWIILHCIRAHQLKPISTSTLSCRLKKLETAFVVGLSLYSISRMIARMLEGPCIENSTYFESVGCNPYTFSAVFPVDVLISVILFPLVMATAFKAISWTTILFAWFVSISVISMTGIMSNNMSLCTLYSLLVYISCSGIVLFETRRKDLSYFLKNRDLVATVAMNIEKSTRKDELRAIIRNVAHDLKSPLAAFMNGTEHIYNLLRKSSDTGEVLGPADIDSINEVLKQMWYIESFMTMSINRCIDYTKASKGLPLIPRMSSFALLEAIMLPYNCMLEMQQLRSDLLFPAIELDISTCIVSDLQWLQENLLCLLSNAAKYSKDGCILTKVKLIDGNTMLKGLLGGESQSESEECEKYLLFEVEDEGIGIPESMRSNVFSTSQQANRLEGGTGLGLYSLGKRIEALNGCYGVRDRYDGLQGCCIWFTLPYKPDNLNSRSASICQVVDEMMSPSPNMTPLAILVVDDAVSITKMCAKMLQHAGHQIDTAYNGWEATCRVQERYSHFTESNECEGDILCASSPFYDVILMDLQMPIMDGFGAIKEIRKFEEEMKRTIENQPQADRFLFSSDRKAKIIAMSANSDHESSKLALLAGADSFMPKPFTYRTFTVNVNKAFNKHE